jgi:hypothetical protein
MLSLARKWRTFSADPSAVFEYRVTTPIRWLLRARLSPLRNALGRYRLRREGVIEVVTEFNAMRPSYSFDADWLDLWGLYSDIRKRKPLRVLEYGSGVSTAVMAYALRRNGAGRLTALESEAGWAAMNDAALPADLRDRCEVLHAPARAVLIDGVKAWRFSISPVSNPDYIYVDGPPGTADRQVTADPLSLDLADGVRIVVDGRTTTKRFLLARLPGFSARYRSLLSNDSIIDRRKRR